MTMIDLLKTVCLLKSYVIEKMGFYWPTPLCQNESEMGIICWVIQELRAQHKVWAYLTFLHSATTL